MALSELIKEKIKFHPKFSISFYDFMNDALYHPELGYYCNSNEKIGKNGDFYTNASVGTVYGEMLALIFQEMIEKLSSENSDLHLVEFGGGTGELMLQILNAWKKSAPDLFQRIHIIMVEKSPFHKESQRLKLQDFSVQWVESLTDYCEENGEISGIVFSNELFDAFPVYLVEYRSGEWLEVRVTWDEDKRVFREVLFPLEHSQVLDIIERESAAIPKIEGYRVEINMDALEWIEQFSKQLKNGYLVTIDYGFTRQDLYIPERRKGTVMCYQKHRVYENPLLDPGEMDITSHVNFSLLIENGEKNGLNHLAFLTQSEFLINGGILDKLLNHQETNPFQGVITKRNRAIRQLIMPEGMGQTFKVLIQAKGKYTTDLSVLKKRSWI